ncbi:MAG: thiolase family protein [Acidobacteriota bacterium]
MANARDVVIVDGIRTPFAKAGTKLKDVHPAELGRVAVKELIDRTNLEVGEVDEVIIGNTGNPPDAVNISRVIALNAGIPQNKSAYTVHRNCASALESVSSGYEKIKSGTMDVVLAGGTESMSNTPYMLPPARWGQRLGHTPLVDGMYRDGFNDPLSRLVMGETAEELAEERDVSREASDEWARDSQARCQAARERGRFASEIAPVTVPGRKGDVVVDRDEHPRDNVELAKLARLKPVFREGGRVSAGNASGITDGAAALLVADADAAHKHGLEPVAYLRDWEVVGVEPRIMGIGPVPACQAIVERNGLAWSDLDQVELNEAFACQVLACLDELPFDRQRVNPDGGAIALGHPIGATGARILVTLLHGLAERNGRWGIATLCVSGGLGIAVLVERVGG